jgi:tRNA-dihydrouridine synthase
VALRHFNRSLEWKGEKLGMLEMRRHYTNYFKGYPNFKEIRMQLVNSLDPSEIRQLLLQVEQTYAGYEPQVVRGLGEVNYAGCD